MIDLNKMGTRTLLYGVHAFWLHPFVVALAWARLYGFPWDFRLWVAFIVHDWGYWGLSSLDDEEGQRHPVLGARIMEDLFGVEWGNFTLRHSRFLARSLGVEPSRLCNADKLAITILPWFIYVPLARATGEIREYKAATKHAKDTGWTDQSTSWKSDILWYDNLQRTMAGMYGRGGSSKADA